MGKAAGIIRTIIIIVIIIALVLLIFFRLGGLVCTLIISVVLSYLLNKPMTMLEKHMKRIWALLIIFGILAGLAFFFFYYMVPMFFRQATELVGFVPQVLKASGALFDSFGKSAGEPLAGILNQAFAGFNDRVAVWLGNATIALAQGGSSSIGWALLLPVFVLYFMKDREFFIDQINYLIPIKYRGDLHALYLSIDKAVGQFLRGQMLVSFSVAVMTSIGLLIIGVPSAPLLGLICGLCNLVPYIGPFIGAVPVALVSVILGWKTMLFSVLVILIVQQLDNMIISPKIIGDSIRIHPVYILIAIIAGSGLFGIMGLLLALPALIILKEITLFVFRKMLRRGIPEAGQPRNSQ